MFEQCYWITKTCSSAIIWDSVPLDADPEVLEALKACKLAISEDKTVSLWHATTSITAARIIEGGSTNADKLGHVLFSSGWEILNVHGTGRLLDVALAVRVEVRDLHLSNLFEDPTPGRLLGAG
jgi:hypothetical protein